MAVPELIQVGERSPKDKKYQTREVVMAMPGTVVAPLEKGVAPTQENAMMAIMQQLMNMHGKMPRDKKGVRGMAGGGTIGPEANPFGMLSSILQAGSTMSQYKLGRMDRDLNREQFRHSFNRDRQDRKAAEESQRASNYASRQSLGNSYRQSQASSNQQAEDNSWRNRQLNIQEQLGNRGLDIESMLGLGGQNLRGQEIAQQGQLGNRQMDIQTAADQFSRIMAGISEASLPGVRGGATPQFGLM